MPQQRTQRKQQVFPKPDRSGEELRMQEPQKIFYITLFYKRMLHVQYNCLFAESEMAMLARLALATLLVAAMLPSALGTSFRYKPRRPFRNSQGLPRGYYYWRPWPNPQDRPRSYYYNKKQAAAPARTEAMTPTTTFEEGSDGETWTGIVQVPKAVADQLFDKVPTDVLATALHVADRCRAELPGDLRVELATRAAGMRGMGELERACGDAKKNRLMAEMARSMPSWTKARLGRGLEVCWRRMSEFQRQDEVGQVKNKIGE